MNLEEQHAQEVQAASLSKQQPLGSIIAACVVLGRLLSSLDHNFACLRLQSQSWFFRRFLFQGKEGMKGLIDTTTLKYMLLKAT
jgi:hypothetical protein